MYFLDKMPQHGLGDFKVGNHAVLHGPDGDDIAGRSSDHVFCFETDGLDFVGVFIDGDNGRLAQDDALPFDVDECVGRPEIDSHIVGKHPWKSAPE